MRSFFALLGAQLGLMLAAWFWQPELRIFAGLGLTLCLTLLGGIIYKATRWWAAALTLPIFAVIAYAVAHFLSWSSS